MADDDKLAPVVAELGKLGTRVGEVEIKVGVLEVAHKEDRTRFADGADHMARTDRKVEGLELGMRELAKDVAADNRAANAAVLTEVEKLRPRPLPWWVRSGIGALAGVAVTVLGFAGKSIWDQRATQAEQAASIHEIKDSAARVEAALRDLIRGNPGKAVTP